MLTDAPSPLAGTRERLRPIAAYHPLIAVALYVVGVVVIERHAVAHLGSVCACDASPDATQYVWALAWFPHAILNGLNPLYTHAIWTPGGLNLAGATSAPAAAIAAWPITALAGPIVSYNILALLAPVLGAFCAYRLCLYVTRSPGASILGGFLYGFSAYEFAAMQEHLHLVFSFTAPLLVLLALHRIDGAISARRFVILTAILLSIQLLISSELLFTMTCMAIVIIAAAALIGRDRRPEILRLAAEVACAYVAMGVLCSWFLIEAARAPAFAQGWGTRYPADALSFVVPGAISRLGGYSFLSVTSAFSGSLTETTAYLGLPLIVIVCSFLARRWRAPATRILAVALAVSVIWSLGDHLHIAGHSTIALPWSLLDRLPAFDLLIPERVALYTALACAIAAAMWLASSAPGRWRRWTLGLLAAAFIVPTANAATERGRVPVLDASWSVPTFFTSGTYKRYLRRGEIVLPLQWGRSGNSLLWQAETGMYFRLASGYFGPPPAAYWREQPIAYELKFNYPSAGAPGQLRRFLADHHVAHVILLRAQVFRWGGVLARAGLRPEVTTGGVVVYPVS